MHGIPKPLPCDFKRVQHLKSMLLKQKSTSKILTRHWGGGGKMSGFPIIYTCAEPMLLCDTSL